MKKQTVIWIGAALIVAVLLFTQKEKIKKAMTRGYRNRNPGNIIKTTGKMWVGEIPGNDVRFKTFKSMAYGYRAIFVVLSGYLSKGINTIEKMINTYAPPFENNTDAYINAVVAKSGTPKNQPLRLSDYNTLKLIVQAISKVENGIEPDMNDIESGLKLWLAK